MQFEGEHLLPGNFGHLFVILAFIASLTATFSFFKANFAKDDLQKKQWLQFARGAFALQVISVLVVFATIFYICFNHYNEYLYVYKHASKELESKYLLACIWEGQEGSFLLWTIWHSLLGIILIRKSKEWEAPVMGIISFAQAFLLVMILGIYFFGVKIGNSPFVLTRNEIAGPIFSQPNYLSFIKDGIGLNVLLRNYWMVIHPPVLFLGFASTIVPFAFAVAGLLTKRFGDWVKPAINWSLFSACVLGVGIMMGGKWAYESLSFGGYWAWDPVENASLVPWLILIAGLHTMVIYKATGHSLRASYFFAILCFCFILYSTFLTRTGILGDTSVHAFTEKDIVIKILLILLMAAFSIPALVLFFRNYAKIPSEKAEEKTNTREFWMFIGAVIIFLSALFIIGKTSAPVINVLFGTKLAPPENVEYSYNKVMVLVAVIIGILTAITQYFKYKNTPALYTIKKIALPTMVAAFATIFLSVFYPVTYYKEGAGFLGAIYVALFAAIYAVVANAAYIWIGLKGNIKSAGGSISHLGFGLMIAGMLIASGNKKTISDNRVTGINIPFGKDDKGKQSENPLENLTLIRDVPTRMQEYMVTYQGDSAGNENGRIFYKLWFTRNDSSENFMLTPDVYVTKDELKSSNPATKEYFSRDIYTYVSSLNPNGPAEDTSQFAIREMRQGDTIFYSNGFFVLGTVTDNAAERNAFLLTDEKIAVAHLTITAKDSRHYYAKPAIILSEKGGSYLDDTVYAQNLYLRFSGVSADGTKLKIGFKESNKIIDFITLKAYVFPYINLVWIGLIIMAIGITMSLLQKLRVSYLSVVLVLLALTAALVQMFLLSN